jgi:hypothetical protein
VGRLRAPLKGSEMGRKGVDQHGTKILLIDEKGVRKGLGYVTLVMNGENC